jgi:hypothetical protein
VLSALRAMAGALGLAAGLACANAEVINNDPGKATVFLRFVCKERVK